MPYFHLMKVCVNDKPTIKCPIGIGYMNEMRQACFEYFKLGGIALSGPVGLLSV